MFIKKYVSPSNVADIIMSSDSEYLTGLWIENTNDSIKHNDKQISCDSPIFDETKKWLDLYFSGVKPNFVSKKGNKL